MFMDKDIYDKIVKKKEFSEIPIEDVERIWNSFDSKDLVDEERIKKVRDLLRIIYSGFGGRKILVWKNKSAEEILKKHLSTRERYDYYEEIYERLLKSFGKSKELNIIDLGSGANGFSYDFFKELGYNVTYTGVEALGQLVNITNLFFKTNKIKGIVCHKSLFEKDKVIEMINRAKKPKIIFMFKVIDALETLERNYTLKFLESIKNSGADKIVISFATESWLKRKKFFVQRTWLINFLKDNFEIIDDFTLGGERYLVFTNQLYVK